MKCPKCKKNNPDENLFCGHCGAVMTLADPSQEARLREMQESTPQTLQEKVFAERPRIEGARKPVTILFTDIVGSTSLAEKLDPEDWREVLEGAHRCVSEAVYRYEGTIAQLLGDGVLAFFGAPITHEDDPIRSVHAALNIQEAIRIYRVDLGDRIDDFQIRIGIHTGTVVVDAIGTDMHMEYLAIGDAVNLAARLESAAEPGSTLVSEEVLKRISHVFATDAVGPLRLKGKRKRVNAYQVRGLLGKPGIGRGIEGMTSPLVGRDAEFKILEDLLEQLKEGKGRIVTIVGEAGIGKSRLIAELRHRAEEPRFPWLEGRCLSYGGTMPYHLWLDLLQNTFNLQGDIAPEEARFILREKVLELCGARFEDVYPYLGNILNIPLEEKFESHIHSLTGQDLKRSTFKAMEFFIGCLAGNAPTVIVCEDLHWSDPTSLELLEKLHAELDGQALLFLSVFRPDITQGSWTYRESISDLCTERYVGIHLEPLSEGSSTLLMKNLVGFEMMPEELKVRILNRSEGNPFFVEEILRSLVDSKVITRDSEAGEWHLQEAPDEIYIPDTLHGVILSRIDRLQVDTKRVLQMASVIGRIFNYQVLDAIAKEENNLDQRLTRLTEEEMIRKRTQQLDLEYIFKHHLTWETAYNALLKKDRKNYHREVGEALERLFPDRIDEFVGVLAHHWERAKDQAKAIDYLLRAGDQARDTYANREAIEFFERAAALLRERSEEESLAYTLMKLGLLYYTVFEFKLSNNAYQEGATAWRNQSKCMSLEPMRTARGKLRMHYTNSYTIDSTRYADPGSGGVINLLFSGLMSITPDLNIVPEIAQYWEIEDEGRTIIFHLRDDVTWSDGKPVTAHDFAFAWKCSLDPKRKSDAAPFLYMIKNARAFHEDSGVAEDMLGIRVNDDWTLIVELERASLFSFYTLATTPTYPVPEHLVRAHGDSWIDPDFIVTNGSFLMKQCSPGECMVLTLRPEYKGAFRGNLGLIELVMDRDKKAGVELYDRDKLDVLEWFHESEINRDMVGRADFISMPTAHFHYFTFDTSKPPFDDSRVRKAFAHAIDRYELTENRLLDLATPALGGLIPPGIIGHSPELGLLFQPEKANELLERAGYPYGQGFPEIEAISLGRRHHDIRIETQFLHDQWLANLGVEIFWKDVEWEEFFLQLSNNPPLYHFGMMGLYPDPYAILALGPSEAKWNQEDALFLELLELAWKTENFEEQIERYREVDRYLIESAMIVPISNYRVHLLRKPWVKDLPYVMDNPCWRDIVIDPH